MENLTKTYTEHLARHINEFMTDNVDKLTYTASRILEFLGGSEDVSEYDIPMSPYDATIDNVAMGEESGDYDVMYVYGDDGDVCTIYDLEEDNLKRLVTALLSEWNNMITAHENVR